MTDQIIAHLISWGNVLSIVVIGVLLGLYIMKWGVKYIILLSLSFYLGLLLQHILPWSVPSLLGLSTQLVELVILTIGVMFLLSQSPVGKSLYCAKKPYGLTIPFGLTVFGLILTHLLPYIMFADTQLAYFVEQTFFGQDFVVVLWTIAPLVFYPFLQSSKRK